ncbi:sulfatase-like hydrolase/transferase [Flavilitoribacter nigricans]|nr:sulfatase-like hydrolase/transferase [Flavilitoribacter nigricans]
MRSQILLFSAGLMLLAACNSRSGESTNTDLPNIVILLADDLGYGDLSCYGGTARTPNLDQLAREGMRFTDFYAAAPNCSPSRVGLLTGRSPSMVGMYNYLAENHPMHLPAEEITIAEILQEKGYACGHFGKWHVSCLPQNPELNQPQPHDQGFDHSLGTGNNAQPSHLDPVNFVRNGQELGKVAGYSCDIVVEEAINWMDTLPADPSPFLMYVAFHEPHKKVASPPDLTAQYGEFPKADAEYFANIENMDRAIGRLLQTLQDKGLDENTLILFASDNGSYRNGSNGPLLGGKSFVYEGGIRVPGILRWKGRIEGGQTVSEPAGLIDIMPTICELSGQSHPRTNTLDGTSLVPLINGQTLERTRPLSWFFYRTSPEIAMRIGDYTILGRDLDTTRHTHPTTQPDMDYIKSMDLEDFELYNLTHDIGQQQNIDYTSLDMGKQYRQQLVDRLQDIQAKGPYWENLPPATGNQKLKSEWRKLHPEGFSN